jgi:DNA mismatch endonuclease (patch repair protein)
MDKFTKKKRSEIMSRIRGKNTRPELVLRKALWSEGFRYRVHYGKEKIDIAFPSKKVAVFVDGCFWHQCPICRHKTPASNRKFWQQKFEKNAERARFSDRKLTESGWTVIHVWEHDVLKRTEQSAQRIIRILQKPLQ